MADVVRAVLMYGVVLDHFAGCADGSTCRAVMEDIVWRQPLELQGGLKWLDTGVRMLGNYKTMAGFLMVSAYIVGMRIARSHTRTYSSARATHEPRTSHARATHERRTSLTRSTHTGQPCLTPHKPLVGRAQDSGYATATHWGRGDAITLLSYLQMIWVLDPLVFSVCAPLLPERCSATAFHYAGVHRWYLLAMLWIKLALMAMRVARLPPLLQCVLVSALAFLVPPEVGCLTSARCESSSADDPAFWRGSLACDPISPLACTRREDGLRTTLAPSGASSSRAPTPTPGACFPPRSCATTSSLPPSTSGSSTTAAPRHAR